MHRIKDDRRGPASFLGRRAIRTLVLSAVSLCALLAFSPTALAATVNVNAADAGSDLDGCGGGTRPGAADPCNTVQAGVNAAVALDTVQVAAGTYTEQVEITEDITVAGAGPTTVIKAPAVLTPSFTEAGGTGTVNFAVVSVENANATVRSLQIDGDGKGQAAVMPGAVPDFEGLAFFNAGGTAQDLTVTRVRDAPLSGVQRGQAIFATNENPAPRTVTIDGNAVADYQKTGILVIGDNLTATVSDNTVTGAGATPQIGQNGIQAGDGVAATVTGNTVSANLCDNPACGDDVVNDVQASGVIVFDLAAGSAIRGNDLTNNDAGIIVDGTVPGLTVEFNRLVGNRVVAIETFAATTLDAENNFFGCNAGPNTDGCDDVFGPLDVSPRLTFRVTASPTLIETGGQTATVTGSVRRNSAGTDLGPIPFPATPVDFATTLGSLSSPTAITAMGAATTGLTSSSTAGTAVVDGALDNESDSTQVVFFTPTNGTDGTNGSNGSNGGVGPSDRPIKTQKLVIVSRSLRVRRGKVRVLVSCPRSNGLCEGTLRLVRKRKVLSTARFEVRGGRSSKITLTLSKKTITALGRSKRVSVTAFSRDLAGAASTSAKKLKLRTR